MESINIIFRMRCITLCSGPEEALGFFYINPLTGTVTVTRPLTETTERQYAVSSGNISSSPV